MWTNELTKEDKQKVEEVLKEARKSNVPIFDRKIIKKKGTLYLLWSESPIHEVPIGKYV